MKAKILADGGKIFDKKKRKQPRISIKLHKCLNRLFIFKTDPVKLNIRRISDLRNNAMHLVIPFIPPDIMGLFQAGVLNYPKALQDWFGINISDRVPLGMMALVYDFDPKMHSLEYPKIRRKLPAETVRWLTSFQQDIRKEAETFGDKVMQFYIPIDLKLAIVKNPTKADIVLSSGAIGQAALIVEVPKDIDKTHPYLRKDVASQVNQKLGGSTTITVYDIHCIVQICGIKGRSDFYYKSKLWPQWGPRYSENFVEWVVSQATRNPDFFNRTRQEAKAKQRKSDSLRLPHPPETDSQ